VEEVERSLAEHPFAYRLKSTHAQTHLMKMEMFFKVLNGEVDIKTFEQWLYATPDVEGMFSPDDYLELISLNYKDRLAKYELIKLLTRSINQGEFETYRLIRLMETIITKSPGWYDALNQCDMLCPLGYYFLEGLEEFAHSLFARNHFENLTDTQKNKLLEMIYPRAAESARKVIDWLKEGKIVMTEETRCYFSGCSSFYVHVFIDNRDDTER
jgi:hypothetical protein